MTDERYPVDAPGWAAIDRLVSAHVSHQVPHQFVSQRAYDLEGNAPLPAITVWEGRGPDHWLYVSYGLSELFEKSSPDPDVSGFGYELTLRLPRAEGEARPPTWPLALVHGVAAGVLAHDVQLDSGHLIDVGGPLVPSAARDPVEPHSTDAPVASPLSGIVCVPDAVLGKVSTPHGSLLFLSLWGLTADELRDMASWTLERKVGLVREVSPLVLTDPRRGPLASDPRYAPVYRRYALGVLV